MVKPISCDSHHRRNGSKDNPEPLPQLVECDPAEVPASDHLEPVDIGDWDDETIPDTTTLTREIAQLREQLTEAGRLFKEVKQEAEQALAEQQREYENLLEEKSELIRSLHRKLHEQQERPAPPANVPREEELLALSEELERDRHQLKEDEEALMQQMGQMEVQMSRERAELARHAHRVAAIAERDPSRTRTGQPRCRSAGAFGPSAAAPAGNGPPGCTGPGKPARSRAQAASRREDPPPRDSGIFRRLFG